MERAARVGGDAWGAEVVRPPAAIQSAYARSIVGAIRAPDVQASNVPGPRADLYLAGTRVEKILGVGPLPGAAMMATLVSHLDRAVVTVNFDPAAVRDAALLRRCLVDAFAEIELLAVDPGDRA